MPACAVVTAAASQLNYSVSLHIGFYIVSLLVRGGARCFARGCDVGPLFNGKYEYVAVGKYICICKFNNSFLHAGTGQFSIKAFQLKKTEELGPAGFADKVVTPFSHDPLHVCVTSQSPPHPPPLLSGPPLFFPLLR